MLDVNVIYSILYANSIATLFFWHRKSNGTDILPSALGSGTFAKTDHGRRYEECLTQPSFKSNYKASSGIRWASAPRSRLISTVSNRSWFLCWWPVRLGEYISRQIWNVSENTTKECCVLHLISSFTPSYNYLNSAAAPFLQSKSTGTGEYRLLTVSSLFSIFARIDNTTTEGYGCECHLQDHLARSGLLWSGAPRSRFLCSGSANKERNVYFTTAKPLTNNICHA